METPIADFVRRYADSGMVRAHMPGHKGKPFLGCEALDITEIQGADSLYEADGIIRRSESYAGELFGSGRIEDGARVVLVGDLKRDAAGEVRLDEPRHHIHARALRRHDEVDARGTGELGEAHEAAFHVLVSMRSASSSMTMTR